MTTSATKMIAMLAIASGMLMASAASAKGPGKSGSSMRSSSMKMSFNGNSNFSKNNSWKSNSLKSSGLKLNFNGNSNHNQFAKNSGLKLNFNGNSNHKYFNKNNSSKITLAGDWNKLNHLSKQNDVFKKKSFDFGKHNVFFNKKDFHLKKNDWCWDFGHKHNWWWNYCYPKHFCYPTYFGCYYPLYNYATYPTYVTKVAVSPTLIAPATEPAAEPARTKVATGSSLMVSGQSFGSTKGMARLRISGLSLPIEVIEWTSAAVKISLPQLELTSSTPADIEVLRTDGSLASKTPVELTPATERVALGQ